MDDHDGEARQEDRAQDCKSCGEEKEEDFVILTGGMSNMDPEVKRAHMMFRAAILQEMGIQTPAAMAVPTPPATEEPAATAKEPSSI